MTLFLIFVLFTFIREISVRNVSFSDVFRLRLVLSTFYSIAVFVCFLVVFLADFCSVLARAHSKYRSKKNGCLRVYAFFDWMRPKLIIIFMCAFCFHATEFVLKSSFLFNTERTVRAIFIIFSFALHVWRLVSWWASESRTCM